MKTIYIIGGTMGVGKTTVCKILNERLENSIFLDGDWCWNMNPFRVTEETKTMVTDNICYLLNSYIHCTAFSNIIFCWVMHEQAIIDNIISRLDVSNCKVKSISLICGETALRKRLQADVDYGLRTADVIDRSIARISLYDKLNTIKIDVSDISPESAAIKIIKM